jgi:ABC-2 type transport system permease protein
VSTADATGTGTTGTIPHPARPRLGRPSITTADLAIARRAFRQLRTAAVVWALVFGVTVATTALSYVSSFPDQASRNELAASTGGDAGLSILLGPISAIDTVGGYVVYKCYVFLTSIGAVWALLATTRLLRGEEDTGRWQLTLAGRTRPPRATAATLAALGTAVAVLFVGTALGALLAGRDGDVGFSLGGSLVYGASVAIAPAVFVGVGAVTSQLGRSRRLATGLGMAAFGVLFVVRMLADSGPGTKWLLWTTPFGWTERVRPFTGTDLRPLVVAAVAVAVLVATAVELAARRDIGAGVLADRDVAPPRPFGLGSPLGLAARLELPVVVAWCVGALATGLSMGIIAKVATGNVPSSVTDLLDKFGAQGTFLRQFLGVAFLFVATVVALLPASQVGAAADEELSGRLVHVLARPARRAEVLAGRLGLAAVAVVVAGLLAGLACWIGAAAQGADPGFTTVVGAGLNVVPTGLLALAIGAVVLAVAPSAAGPAVYGVVIWSLIVDLLSSMVDGLRWLDRLSLFHYMALAPADDPDPTTLALTTVAALALTALALTLYARRDLRTG